MNAIIFVDEICLPQIDRIISDIQEVRRMYLFEFLAFQKLTLSFLIVNAIIFYLSYVLYISYFMFV